MRESMLSEIGKYIFNPRSIAVIGASSDRKKELGGGWVGRLVQFGYEGKIYPINPKAETVLDIKAYPSVSAVPDDIDYVIVSIPSQHVLEAVKECIAKKVKVVHVYAAGFSEIDKEEGKARQKEMENVIHSGETMVIGPNCLGVYSPKNNLSFDIRFSKEAGTIGFLSQTGVGGRKLVNLANERGLRFSNVVSYGNAIDLDGPDFLEYFADDPETKEILVYVEGVKNGRKFFTTLRECTKIKPVVLLKAGLSKSGAGAAASHTGSLAGSREVWQALFRQTGVIPVQTLEEAVDQLVAVIDVPEIKGKRIGLIGRGGGFGVIASDLCEAHGLVVPRFCDETRAKLAELTPAEAGSSVRNPVEIGLGRRGLSEYYAQGVEIVGADPLIDIIITYLNPEDYLHYGLGDWADAVSRELVKVVKNTSKPFIVSFMQGRNPQVFELILKIQDKCQEAGIACYSSIENAIKAASKLADYYEFRNRERKR